MTFDALRKIIKKSDIASLRRELDSGVSPNLSNQFSWTLIMLAAIEGNLSMGELLISRGADVNAINDLGETPLSLAAQGGHARFVRALLDSGALVDCHPHGSSLEDWVRISSGLSQDKIASILNLINSAKSR
jgi:ankyrin repeat protein